MGLAIILTTATAALQAYKGISKHIHTIVLPLYFLFAYLSLCLYYVSMARLCGQEYTPYTSVSTASADGCFHRIRYGMGIRQSGGLHRLPSYNGKNLSIYTVSIHAIVCVIYTYTVYDVYTLHTA